MRRLNECLIKSNYSSLTKLDLRKRHLKLRNIEGWYNANPLLPRQEKELYSQYEELKKEYNLLKQSGKTQQRFTRWLSRNKKINNPKLLGLESKLNTIPFKISCKFQDILRVIESPHYKSCFNDLDKQGKQLYKYLCDPDMALIYVPDKAGHFKWRAFIRLIKLHNGKTGILVYQGYGNTNEDSILNALTQLDIGPIFKATQDVHSSFDLKSYSKINNKFIEKSFWSDIYYTVRKGYLCFKGDAVQYGLKGFEAQSI